MWCIKYFLSLDLYKKNSWIKIIIQIRTITKMFYIRMARLYLHLKNWFLKFKKTNPSTVQCVYFHIFIHIKVYTVYRTRLRQVHGLGIFFSIYLQNNGS